MQVIETANHEYRISLTVSRCERIKSLYKIDLMEGKAQSVFSDFAIQPRTRLNVLWEMISDKSECPKVKNPDYDPDISEDDPAYVKEFFTRKETFFEALEGAVLQKAESAFWDELAFFFQNLNPMMVKYVTTMREQAEKLAGKVEAAFEQLLSGEKLEQMEDRELQKAVAQAEKEMEKALAK